MPDQAKTTVSQKFAESLLWRRLKIIGLLVLIGSGIMFGFIWYQEAALREARLLLEQNQASRALTLIDDWQTEHRMSDASQALRARCLVDLGRYSAAIQIFETVGGNSADEVHAWATAHLHLQQWSNALPLLQLAMQKDPENVDMLHELAACQAKLGQLNDAVETAHEFIEKSPDPHRGLLLLGVLYQQLGNKEQAAEAWNKIEEHDPEFADLQIPPEEFLTQLAGLELDLGHLKRVRELAQKSLTYSETAVAFFLLGQAEDQLGNQADAEIAWQKSLDLDPTQVRTREALARIAISRGDAEQAEELLKPVIENTQIGSSTAYLMERIAIRQKDQDKAQQWRERTEKLRSHEQIEAALSQMLRENPNSYWGLVVRCYRFAQNQNWQQATEIISSIPVREGEHEFVLQLRKSIKQKSAVPPLELVPIKNF